VAQADKTAHSDKITERFFKRLSWLVGKLEFYVHRCACAGRAGQRELPL
jgi:hypothetical protein